MEDGLNARADLVGAAKIIDGLNEALAVEQAVTRVRAADIGWMSFNPSCECRFCTDKLRSILMAAQGGRLVRAGKPTEGLNQ
jgi:hypothetical protein